MKNISKIAIIFTLLFVVYHAAEFMIVFKNNPFCFFAFQGLFFILAWILGNWYSQNGLSAWGVVFTNKAIKVAALGSVMGIVLYGLPFAVCLWFGIEKIINIPDLKTIFITGLPFIIGVLFSSISEDILTRGVIYAQFHTKLKSHCWL